MNKNLIQIKVIELNCIELQLSNQTDNKCILKVIQIGNIQF